MHSHSVQKRSKAQKRCGFRVNLEQKASSYYLSITFTQIKVEHNVIKMIIYNIAKYGESLGIGAQASSQRVLDTLNLMLQAQHSPPISHLFNSEHW